MKYLARLCLCILTAVIVLAALSSGAGSWLGQDEDIAQLSRRLVFESRRSEALYYRHQGVIHSLAIMEATTAEVLAGRLTLREAAERFRQAHESIENGQPDLVPNYQMPTTEEEWCRNVLLWARGTRTLRPEEKRRIVERLEQEFQKMFDSPKAIPPP